MLLAKLAGAMKANLSKAAATVPGAAVPDRPPGGALQDKREQEGAASRGLSRPRAHQTTFIKQLGKDASTMAKLSTDELLDAFKEMTLIELSEFVKQFEEIFDVKAAAPVAVAGCRPAGAAAGRGRSRSRTSSTSSSRPTAARRSRSSRSCAS